MYGPAPAPAGGLSGAPSTCQAKHELAQTVQATDMPDVCKALRLSGRAGVASMLLRVSTARLGCRVRLANLVQNLCESVVARRVGRSPERGPGGAANPVEDIIAVLSWPDATTAAERARAHLARHTRLPVHILTKDSLRLTPDLHRIYLGLQRLSGNPDRLIHDAQVAPSVDVEDEGTSSALTR